MSGGQLAAAAIGILLMAGGAVGQVRIWATRHRSQRKMRRMIRRGRSRIAPY